MKVSFEIVPRDEQSIAEQIELIKELDFVNMVNIPDIPRFSTRSWEVKVPGYKTIPHIRAMDFELGDKKLFQILNHTQDVLVVRGDEVKGLTCHNTSTIEMIKFIKGYNRNIKVYAAMDPYKTSIKETFEDAQRKLDAGADFLMTQPFFDIDLLKFFAKELDPKNIFFGFSPVITEKSKAYWENVNNATFPKDFQLTYGWNENLFQEILEFVISNKSNMYIMPINIDLKRFFNVP